MNKPLVVVSACLLGVNCRYDGKSSENEEALALLKDGRALPVCPEQLGGMPTPRKPVEIVDGKVVAESGNDYTEEFVRGAAEAARLAELSGCTEALLQPRSPSCGCGTVYDGSFSGKLTPGDGFFARLLKQKGFAVRPAK